MYASARVDILFSKREQTTVNRFLFRHTQVYFHKTLLLVNIANVTVDCIVCTCSWYGNWNL